MGAYTLENERLEPEWFFGIWKRKKHLNKTQNLHFCWFHVCFPECTLPKTNIASENLVFQPSLFRGYVSFPECSI